MALVFTTKVELKATVVSKVSVLSVGVKCDATSSSSLPWFCSLCLTELVIPSLFIMLHSELMSSSTLIGTESTTTMSGSQSRFPARDGATLLDSPPRSPEAPGEPSLPSVLLPVLPS